MPPGHINNQGGEKSRGGGNRSWGPTKWPKEKRPRRGPRGGWTTNHLQQKMYQEATKDGAGGRGPTIRHHQDIATKRRERGQNKPRDRDVEGWWGGVPRGNTEGKVQGGEPKRGKSRDGKTIIGNALIGISKTGIAKRGKTEIGNTKIGISKIGKDTKGETKVGEGVLSFKTRDRIS
jgi:hypothetical protein